MLSMNFLNEFDLKKDLIYLNSGTLSISPRSVLDAVVRYQRKFEENPTAELIESWSRLWDVQKELAEFICADPHDLFLRSNITAALNDFLLGIPLEAPGEILATNLEYGAILNICRLRAERDGLKLRSLHLPTACEEPEMDQKSIVDRIVSEIRPETRLLLVSHVVTGTGVVIPIQELALETQKRGVFLVVDGAHAPGAIDVDFRTFEGIDFYGGNLHKWIMGPKGTGFGWVPKRHQSILRPIQAGWTTFEIPLPFEKFGDRQLFTARYLLASCDNFAPFFALHEIFEFWKKHGKSAIFCRLRELQRCVDDEVTQSLGWSRLSPSQLEMRGPLLSYDLPDSLAEMGYSLMEKLLREHRLQIMVTPVQGRFRLRLSPHIYNTEAEIRTAVQVLKRLA